MIAFTIVSRAYVPYARVLARSFARHHPGQVLRVLLIDDVEGEVVEAEEPFDVVRPADLPLSVQEFHRMAMLFSGRVIASIKPWVFEYFLDGGADAVVYLDSDMAIFDDLSVVAEAAAAGGVAVVPHVLQPMPRDGLDPDETTILGVGVYNAGLFAVGRHHGGFLQFLQERLARECRFDTSSMRCNEQRWLDFVPSVFPHRVVRDAGVDVAYWNLHERPLAYRDDRWFVGEVPLRCFHFSSFHPYLEKMVGRCETSPHPRVVAARDPLLTELCRRYAAEVVEAGFESHHTIPFAYEVLADGAPVPSILRQLFRLALLGAEGATIERPEAEVVEEGGPPDPFDPATAPAFRQWAEGAYRSAALPVPRWLRHVGPASVPEVPSPGVGRRRRLLRGTRAEPAPPSHPPPARVVKDWLADLFPAPAGIRWGHPEVIPGSIGFALGRAGLVCVGPHTQLAPGSYRLELQLQPDAVAPGTSGLDQAVTVEALVGEHLVAGRGISVQELQGEDVDLEFTVPPDLRDEALLAGVDLRIRTRGVMSGALVAAVLTQHPGDGQVVAPLERVGLLDAGPAGRRAGQEVVAVAAGNVCRGPAWGVATGGHTLAVAVRVGEGDADAPPVVHVRVEGEDGVALAQVARPLPSPGGQVDVAFEAPGGQPGGSGALVEVVIDVEGAPGGALPPTAITSVVLTPSPIG